jgi:hypothetical protein
VTVPAAVPFPPEILQVLEDFCAKRRTGKIEIEVKEGQVMTVKGAETWFDANRKR